MHTTWRLARAGLAAAVVVAVAGWAAERVRFGASDQEAVARIAGELRQRFAASADSLGRIAARLVADRTLIASAPRGQVPVARLFDAVDAALAAEEKRGTGVTVYDAAAAPIAWAGRTSNLSRPLNGPAALFVAPGALGPRLVRIEPVVDATGPPPPALATMVVEQQLGAVIERARAAATRSSSGTRSFRSRSASGSAMSRRRAAYTFVIPSPGGGPLVDAEVSPAALAEARARWRGGTWAAVLSVVGSRCSCVRRRWSRCGGAPARRERSSRPAPAWSARS